MARKRKNEEAKGASAQGAPQAELIDIRDFTVAYVLIKAQLGWAPKVAASVSALEGVRWAVIVTGPYDVLAGIRVPNNDDLEAVVLNIQAVPGVANPSTNVMTSYYQGGEKKQRIFNGPP